MKTVAMYLGANRSLTTISSAMMALHPEVTVLNHTFSRIFADKGRDFIADPVQEKLDTFVAEARTYALGGQRGDYGGHILHSHAFDDKVLRQTYLDRFGWDVKPESQCLLWKDATKLTNYLIHNKIDPGAAASRLPSLRFVMIVRNPIDICISSIKKGYSEALVGTARKDVFIDVFVHMIKLFAWFSRPARDNPEQFRFVFQDELLDPDKLIELCAFLGTSADPAWLDDIARLIRLRDSYPVADTQKAELKALTKRVIPDEFFARRVVEQIV